jgi:hypothetical protein
MTKLRKQEAALLSQYTAQQNGQGTRLIGFVVGLFTLLQLTQALDQSALSRIFPNFISFLQLTAPWGDFLKVLFLFMGTWVILYFILRSIFRFSVYGHLSSAAMYVTEEEAEEVVVDYSKNSKNPEKYKKLAVWAINIAVARIVYDKKVWRLPACWFASLPKDPKYPNCYKKGFGFLSAFSFVVAFLLLLFLW